MVHVIVWLQPTIDSYLYPYVHQLVYTLVLHAPHAICYTSLAVDSHTVHFQTTTHNKRTYEPACCIVSNTYVT